MDIQDFMLEIDRLRQAYPNTDKFYAGERITIWFDALKFLTKQQLHGVISHLIALNRQPPGYDEISPLARAAYEAEVLSRRGIQATCVNCDSYGSVTFVDLVGTERQVACCRCPSGDRLARGNQNDPRSRGMMRELDARRNGWKRVSAPTPLDEKKVATRDDVGCPWPASIRAIMSMIAGGTEKGLRFALKHQRISEDDAWTLYEFWTAKDYDAAPALEILKKARGDRVLDLIKENLKGNIRNA